MEIRVGDILNNRECESASRDFFVCNPVNKSGQGATRFNSEVWERLGLKQTYDDACQQFAEGMRGSDNLAQYICQYAEHGFLLCNLFVLNDDLTADIELLRRSMADIHKGFPQALVQIPYKLGTSMDNESWKDVLNIIAQELADKGQSVEIWMSFEQQRLETRNGPDISVELLQQKLFDLAMQVSNNGAEHSPLAQQLISLSTANVKKDLVLSSGKKGYSVKVLKTGDKVELWTTDPDGGMWKAGEIAWNKKNRLYQIVLFTDVDYPEDIQGHLLPVLAMKNPVELRDGRLYCTACRCWIPNTANLEMRKEGFSSHSHVCGIRQPGERYEDQEEKG